MSDDNMSLTDKSMLEQNNKEIYDALKEVLYTEDQNMIRKTSLDLFKKFMRFFKTADCST